MIPATEGVVRLQIKSKSSMPWTARGCRPLLFDETQYEAYIPKHVPIPFEITAGKDDTYYTRHLVLLWKRVWDAWGLIGRLAAAKRRMLSFADTVFPSAEVPLLVGVELLDSCETPLTTGIAEGMMAGGEEVASRD